MVACAILAIGAVTIAAPTAAAATYPVKPFTVKYGNTYTTGKVTFYNQSALVELWVKSVASDDCRSARAATYDKIEMHESMRTQDTCGTTHYFSETLSATNTGGAEYVLVELIAGCCGANNGKTLAKAKVYRN